MVLKRENEEEKIPKKIKILRFIAEQQKVTVNQVSRLFKIKETTSIRLFRKLNLVHMKIGSVKYGVWKIGNKESVKLLAQYYPDDPAFHVRSFNLPELYHCLRVTDVRILLESSAHVSIAGWQSEEVMRSLPPQLREFSYSKIPDAVFTVDFGKDQRRFYLEYERTFKNPARYKKIFSFYDTRTDIGEKQIIYVCEDERIKNRLLHIPKMDPKYVFYTWGEIQQKYTKGGSE